MTEWRQNDLRPHMKIYSSDAEHIGHIAEIFEDSFLIHQGLFLSTNIYLPYSAIASVEGERIELTLNANEVKDAQWEKRPDYENHLGDPTQLFYDEGHGIANPFDKTQSH